MSLIPPPTILVTGATGNVGKNVVSQLVSSGTPARALTRNPATAKLGEGVEVVQGNLAESSTLDSALSGIESVFLICRGYNSIDIGALISTPAKRVRRIVFMSSSAIEDELSVQTNPIGKIHLEVEQAIRRAGVEWTFLRPGAFAANALTWWAPQLRSGDVLRWPYPNAAWPPVHEQDIASVAVRALLESGHTGKTYFLTGGEILTQASN